MGHRPKADVELARLISDRLALVLAERPPRRARDPGPGPAEVPGTPDTSSTVRRGRGHEDTQTADELLLSVDAPELPKQRFGRMHVGVISMLLVLGLITAGWMLLRARPVAVASPGGVVTLSMPTADRGVANTLDQQERCKDRCPRPRSGPSSGPGQVEGQLTSPGCDRCCRRPHSVEPIRVS